MPSAAAACPLVPPPATLAPVPLDKAVRLINHGPTVLVSSTHQGTPNVMAAAWACALDFAPPKLSLVLDKASATRHLLEQSGHFIVQVPTAAQARLTRLLGTHSLHNTPDKLARSGAQLMHLPGQGQQPFVAGCAAWLACTLLPEPHNQQTYDLFIGQITAAWADTRAFCDGHWQFETAPPEWRTLHHVAGGHFYAIGQPVHVDQDNAQ